MNWHVVFAISSLVIIATSIILVMGFKMEHHDYKGWGLFFDFLFEFHEIIILLICALFFFRKLQYQIGHFFEIEFEKLGFLCRESRFTMSEAAR